MHIKLCMPVFQQNPPIRCHLSSPGGHQEARDIVLMETGEAEHKWLDYTVISGAH